MKRMLVLMLAACSSAHSGGPADAEGGHADAPAVDGSSSDGEPNDAAIDGASCGACNSPPSPVCIDSTTLRTFASGTCSEGACTYAPTDTTCPHGCAEGACQPASGPTTLVPGQSTPFAIAVDGGDLYWANITFGGTPGAGVWRASTAGANPVRIAADPYDPYTLAVDANNVYWLSEDAGYVWMAARPAGAAHQLGSVANTHPSALAVVSGTLYWAGTNTSTAYEQAVTDTAPSSFGSGLPIGVLAAAASPSAIWFGASDGATTTLCSIARSTGGTAACASASGNIPRLGLIVVGDDLYWTDQGTLDGHDGRLMRSAMSSPGSATALLTGLDAPIGLASDGVSLYWVEQGAVSFKNGSVKKRPLAGGAVTVIASGQNTPQGIAVDATSVYWTDLGSFSEGHYAGDGAIMAAPK